MARLLYEHGLPFSKKLAENVDDALVRVDNNKATCFIVSGGVGEGKTTLAVHLADYINQKRGLPLIDLEVKNHPQLTIGGKEFAIGMRKCFMNGLPVIIYDEGGDYSKRGAMSSFNAFLNRIFETYRAFKIVVIICLPNMAILDNALFDNRIPRMVLHCFNRSQKDGDFKGYSLHRAFYLRFNMKKFEDKNFAYRLVDANFYGHFLNLDSERCKKLDKLSTAGKLDILESAELKLDGLINQKELAIRLNKSQSWVFNVLKQLKINKEKVIRRVNYYKNENIEILQDFISNGGTIYSKEKYNPEKNRRERYERLAREKAQK